MNIKSYRKLLFLFVAVSLILTSCFNDLNVEPIDDDEITSAVVYDDPDSYKQVLAKLYAGLAVSGQQGPAGQPDISGIDEGFSTYIRQYWKAQELTTDEAVIAWNDGNIQDYHQQDWDAANEFVAAMYNRIYYQISLVNEFLRETTDEKLDERDVDPGLRTEIATFRAEARFLRALSYWHALDLFRNVPFVTEEDPIGSFFPEQTNANDLFAFIESELIDIESDLAPATSNEYGRADQGAAWTLLAKLYLNAEVYVGTDRYSDVLTTCEKIINAGYSLEPDFAQLYLADNHNAEGIIFPVNFDGISTRTWGGMTFLVHAAVGGSMDPAAFGVDGGWGGMRVTSAIVDKFPSATGGSSIVDPVFTNDDYPVLYVPGSYQGWDPANTETVIKSVNSDSTYEGYFQLTAGDEFKFTPNANWDADWGDDGADGTLDPGGANIQVAEDGYYKVNVNLNDLTYTIVKTEWGLIGDATPGGWDSDTDMTYDTTENAWVVMVELSAGEVKFRANDAWDIDYGDNGADAILEAGGSNIAIPGPGTYTIKMYLGSPDYTYSIERPSFDSRTMFHTDGQNLEINDISQFTDGYAVTKFRNVTSGGAIGSDLTFPDTDFLMFRLADVYLMYAEAALRTNTNVSQALEYVNLIRERAYGDASGNITGAEFDLDFILDERARELLWECHRRTDLVRFGRYSNTTYLWPWKGGVPEGTAVPDFYDVFPIPASDIGANPNLQQNTGY
jgi:hypothetical protein